MSLAAPLKTQHQAPHADDLTIDYPDGDGKPMAETPEHINNMIYGISALRYFYEDNPDVWVAGNNFIYYEMNSPRVRVSPDMYVVFGVPNNKPRRSYYTWRENDVAPSIVFELTSKSTKNEDITRKKVLYEQVLRVPEYLLFDPTEDYLHPNLQGYRLQNGVYVPIVPSAPGRLFSQVLGLEIVSLGEEMRFFDPVRRIYLESYEEALRRADADANRADAEARRAAEAEAENVRLRTIIAQLTQQDAPTDGGEDA